MKKTTLLKGLVQSNRLEFIMEAHNALSAKIVEESGFKGIWASGLSISAALGVRDSNEASWTQVLEICEFMSDATKVPILIDADTGYGNFNNVHRLVKKLEQRDIAGLCIEDKIFPKTNSFIQGELQSLADIDEMCGKIKCAKDTQKDSDFMVVARTESFITGKGLDEALQRAYAYQESGADAILVHSKSEQSDEIEMFMRHWKSSTPIVIVPTTYHKTPTELFEKLDVSLVIWANHNLRACIVAMQQLCQQVMQEKSIANVEGKIAKIQEIFRLQRVDDLKQMEKCYLPDKKKSSSDKQSANGTSKCSTPMNSEK